jgi:hypothetical protein
MVSNLNDLSQAREHIATPPPEFDPKLKHRTGQGILRAGRLSPLPDVLDYAMAIPVAYWATSSCAVVAFVEFHRDRDDGFRPAMVLATFGAHDGTWRSHNHFAGVGWSHDPIACPDDRRDLGGQPVVTSGGAFTAAPAPGHPAAVVVGRAIPAVKHIAIVQDGMEDRRALRSHFGAWVVCVDRWSPYQINGLDSDGGILASVQGPPPLPSR